MSRYIDVDKAIKKQYVFETKSGAFPKSEYFVKVSDLLKQPTVTEKLTDSALDKQIPKSLVETDEYTYGCCSKCLKYINYIKREYFDFDYCPFCGQRIKWEENK